MAGTIVVDRIESDASYASNINVASQITFSNTVNFGITSVAPVAGFYSPSTNNVAFTTASTERMRISPSGNVLIGTTTTQTGAVLAVTGGIQGTITSGTAVASTSGTSIDFTSIPSWVKRITVMFNGVSTNGSTVTQIQIGDSGGIETSGYTGSASTIVGGAVGQAALSAGFVDRLSVSASTVRFATVVLSLIDTSNTFMCSGMFANTNAAGETSFVCGSKTLSATLDRVRVTTANGTDTFDAGSINILYEG